MLRAALLLVLWGSASATYGEADPASAALDVFNDIANQEATREGLSRSKDYWAAFDEVMARGPVRTPKPTSWLAPTTYPAISALFDSNEFWPGRLSMTPVDLGAVLLFATNAERWHRQANNLMERMTGAALVGIAFSALHQAATVADDPDAGELVARQLRQFHSDKPSLTRALVGEQRYAEAMLEQDPPSDAELETLRQTVIDLTEDCDPPLLSGCPEGLASRDELRREREESRLDYEQVSPHLTLIAELSEVGDASFWKDGVSSLRSQALNNPALSEAAKIWLTGWVEYLIHDRQLRLLARLYEVTALSYAEKEFLASPETAAPEHWQWDWRPAEERFCLKPLSIHPSVEHWTLENTCVTTAAVRFAPSTQPSTKKPG